MRILIVLTYYRPHISGLTIYAERLARGLVARGHRVRVLTSRFHPRLPAREIADGVDVLRVPIAAKISKGVVMPLFPAYAWSAVRDCEVVNVHMPQLEASLLAGMARLSGRPAVITYHGDLRLPPGAFNRSVQGALLPLNHAAALAASRIVVTTQDYADHSPYLRRYRAKVEVIPPLIELPAPDPAITRQLAERYRLNGHTRIGFAARFSAEKGVEYLLEALPRVIERLPDVGIAFTGAYRDTVGEAGYQARLRPLLERYGDRLTFLDLLRPEELPSFFSLCDVVAVTSLNSTESFGLVQAESMLSGTPVVASDLPGVRQAVQRTGMGELVPPRDPQALADALVRVIQQRPQYRRPRQELERQFDLRSAITQYEDLFARLSSGVRF